MTKSSSWLWKRQSRKTEIYAFGSNLYTRSRFRNRFQNRLIDSDQQLDWFIQSNDWKTYLKI